MLIDDVYEVGIADWDTNVCQNCGKEMETEDARIAAIRMMLYHGMCYYCKACMDGFMKSFAGTIQSKGHIR